MSNRFGKRLVSRLMPSFLGKSDVFLFFCFIFWPKRYRDALGGGLSTILFGKSADLRGFNSCHLLCSSRAAPFLAFAEEFVSIRRFIIYPPHLLQLYQHLLFLAHFSVFICPLLLSCCPSLSFLSLPGAARSFTGVVWRTHETKRRSIPALRLASSPGQKWATLPQCHGWNLAGDGRAADVKSLSRSRC